MKKFARSLAINTIGFAGIGLVTFGIGMWSLPCATIFSGVVLFATAIISALPARPKPQ